jgi:hypothetical protein
MYYVRMKPSVMHALLMAHDGPGIKRSLTSAYVVATTILGADAADPPIRSLKSARLKAHSLGLLDTERRGRHFYTTLTERGAAELRRYEEEGGSTPEPEIELPAVPFRVDNESLLDRGVWTEVMKAVKRGEVDIVVIRPDQLPKVGPPAWNEARR